MIAKISIVAAAALAALAVAACDRSAQPADGATAKGEVGTAANTPTGQVVPTTGTNEEKLNAPEITAAPAEPAAGSESANRAAP